MPMNDVDPLQAGLENNCGLFIHWRNYWNKKLKLESCEDFEFGLSKSKATGDMKLRTSRKV